MSEGNTLAESQQAETNVKGGINPKLLILTEKEQDRRDAALEKLDRIKQSLKTTHNIRRNSTYVSPYPHQREALKNELA
jgi:hypothetical protein